MTKPSKLARIAELRERRATIVEDLKALEQARASKPEIVERAKAVAEMLAAQGRDLLRAHELAVPEREFTVHGYLSSVEPADVSFYTMSEGGGTQTFRADRSRLTPWHVAAIFNNTGLSALLAETALASIEESGGIQLSEKERGVQAGHLAAELAENGLAIELLVREFEDEGLSIARDPGDCPAAMLAPDSALRAARAAR